MKLHYSLKNSFPVAFFSRFIFAFPQSNKITVSFSTRFYSLSTPPLSPTITSTPSTFTTPITTEKRCFGKRNHSTVGDFSFLVPIKNHKKKTDKIPNEFSPNHSQNKKNKRASKLSAKISRSGISQEEIRHKSVSFVEGYENWNLGCYFFLTNVDSKKKSLFKNIKLESFKDDNGNIKAPNTRGYNDFLRLAISQNKRSLANGLYREMKDKNIQLTSMTYVSLISSCKKNVAAERFFQHLIYSGLEPKAAVFNALITVCGKEKDWQMATKWLDSMKAKKVNPSLRTYNIYLKVLTDCGEFDRGIEYFEQMKKNEYVTPDLVTYNTMMQLYGKQGAYAKGIELFQELQEKEFPVESRTLSIAIRLYGQNGQFRTGLRLLEKYKGSHGTKGELINDIVIKTIIDTCRKYGNAGDGTRTLSFLELPEIKVSDDRMQLAQRLFQPYA